jgi:hypothetical protein
MKVPWVFNHFQVKDWIPLTITLSFKDLLGATTPGLCERVIEGDPSGDF